MLFPSFNASIALLHIFVTLFDNLRNVIKLFCRNLSTIDTNSSVECFKPVFIIIKLSFLLYIQWLQVRFFLVIH